MTAKRVWQGKILSIQPRIRLLRSFDERSHSYLGYVLVIEGDPSEEGSGYSIGIGKGAQAEHQFKAGDIAQGEALPVADPRKEPVEFYKASKLRVVEERKHAVIGGPPWLGVPPDLETYRARGHRRLDARTFQAKCQTCMWGCRMPVEMIIDQWNPSRKQYRFETFCYGPKSCPSYSAGPNRTVPGRKGMKYVKEDWVDEDVVSHRSDDE